ncbi:MULTISPECIES: hypothetical protein [unclassified Crossiella]|uniref:hypothetical protein n=1 Tax=unclassified Crossiella TaxID=2620835 RepID=UPI001FFE9A17|nr:MULTISPECIES: hypothetical protein [unclassified Crossiella]MCK2242059.1 hypothetical protein [Crossiella sp. S99.2]MCK2255962.1 hypothetical protein [Crossiella sp. S99.1]
MRIWIAIGSAMGRTALVAALAWLGSSLAGVQPPWLGLSGLLLVTSLAGVLATLAQPWTPTEVVVFGEARYRKLAARVEILISALIQAVLVYLLLIPIGAGLAVPVPGTGVLVVLVCLTALPAPWLVPRSEVSGVRRLEEDHRTARAIADRLDTVIARLLDRPEVLGHTGGVVELRRQFETDARRTLARHSRAQFPGRTERRLREQADQTRQAVLRAVPASWPVRLARHWLFPLLCWVVLGAAISAAGVLVLAPLSPLARAVAVFLALTVALVGAHLIRRMRWAAGLPGYLLGLATAVLALAGPTHPATVAAVVLPVAAVLGLLMLLQRLRSLPYGELLRALTKTATLDWDRVPGVPLTLVHQAKTAELEFLDRLVGLLLPRQDAEAVPRRYGLLLPDLNICFLGELSRPEGFVRSDTSDRIEWLVDTLAQSSVGVSGPRGVGKSTLLRRLCGRDLADHLTVFVPAPTSYDRREFLVHLFQTVCEQVVRTSPGGLTEPSETPSARRLLGTGLVTLGALIAVLGFGWDLVSAGRGWVAGNPEVAIGIGGLAVALAGVVVAEADARAERRRGREASSVVTLARQNLRTLRFQRKDTANRTGGMKLAAGLEFSAGRGREHTELVRGYPELVGDLREFLELLGQDGKVVIGIDELDKIDTAEDAERFLNDLKSLFGVRGCHFLVSVSEDALAAFDLRALTVRSTFDSAFDEVVAVSRLDLAHARQLLAGRALVLPEPFLWLCHSLAGGLPRDLLRAVLNLVHAKEKTGSAEFTVLSGHLIAADLRSVVDGQLRRAAALDDPTAAELTGWLARATDPSRLGPLLADPPALQGDAVVLGRQSAAYLGYLATMAGHAAEPGEWRDLPDEKLDLLARARAALAVDPDLAVVLTKRFSSE